MAGKALVKSSGPPAAAPKPAIQSPIKVADVKPWEISQSTLLLGVVLVGFVVWLLLNGKLQTYWALLNGGKAPSGSAGAQAAAQPPATVVPNTALTQQSANAGVLGDLGAAATIASDLAFLG